MLRRRAVGGSPSRGAAEPGQQRALGWISMQRMWDGKAGDAGSGVAPAEWRTLPAHPRCLGLPPCARLQMKPNPFLDVRTGRSLGAGPAAAPGWQAAPQLLLAAGAMAGTAPLPLALAGPLHACVHPAHRPTSSLTDGHHCGQSQRSRPAERQRAADRGGVSGGRGSARWGRTGGHGCG